MSAPLEGDSQGMSRGGAEMRRRQFEVFFSASSASPRETGGSVSRPLMQYWACYDIADDRRRQRLSDVLLDFGTRVQESVFQCLIDASLAEECLCGYGERSRRIRIRYTF